MRSSYSAAFPPVHVGKHGGHVSGSDGRQACRLCGDAQKVLVACLYNWTFIFEGEITLAHTITIDMYHH